MGQIRRITALCLIAATAVIGGVAVTAQVNGSDGSGGGSGDGTVVAGRAWRR